MSKDEDTFRFRRGDSIGAVDAENDAQFLSDCFVDNGDLDCLLDTANPKCIVVGRTGSGKSALLLKLASTVKDNSIVVDAESLSLRYIANSDILNTLLELKVNLDPFFKLLWRHVIVITILQHIRPLTLGETKQGWFSRLLASLRNDRTSEAKAHRHSQVVAFLRDHANDDFWADTGTRVSGIVENLERTIKATASKDDVLSFHIGGEGASIGGSLGDKEIAESSHTKSLENTIEVRRRFEKIVSNHNLADLDGMLSLAGEVLEDAGRDVYLTVDKLDTNWTDEKIRLRLIRALIDTAVSFRKVSRAKIVLALRTDLIEKLFRDAHLEPGNQQEKLKDHYITLSWDRRSLITLLDKRVNSLIQHRYSKNRVVSHTDVINATLKKGRRRTQRTIDFIIDRSWYRPRDVLEFFNLCIERSSGKPKISDDAVIAAEGAYSLERLQSLSEEWQLEYPQLEQVVKFIWKYRSNTTKVRVGDITIEEIHDLVVIILGSHRGEGSRIVDLAVSANRDVISIEEMRLEIAFILYRTGVVGVQLHNAEKPLWASDYAGAITPRNIHDECVLYLHHGLHKALAIKGE